MKIRNGFVSNSSSSSFLIYGTELEESDIDKFLEKLGKEKIDKFLKDEHENQLKWSKEAEPYESLEEYINQNCLSEALDTLLPKVICLAEENEFYYGISPSEMYDDETMREFKKRVEEGAKKLMGKKVKCSFISREYQC